MKCKSINSALFYICNLARQSSLSAANYETIYATTNPDDKESLAEKISQAERIKTQIEKLCSPLEFAIFNFYYGFSDKFNGNDLDFLAQYCTDYFIRELRDKPEIKFKKHFSCAEKNRIIVQNWQNRFARCDLELAAVLNITDRQARYILGEAKWLIDLLDLSRLKFYHNDYVLASEIATHLIREGILSKNYT